jgi:hypothetical protein
MSSLMDDEDAISGVFRNALLTSFALPISAAINVHNPGQVSLVDGILVSGLQTMVGIPVIRRMGVMRGIRGATVWISYFLAHISFCIFAIVCWARVRTFGSPSGCDINESVKVVLMVWTISAVDTHLRGAEIASVAIFLGVGLFKAVTVRRTNIPLSPPGWKKIPLIVLTLFLWAFSIVSIELTLRRNGLTEKANSWTYGQTLSMVMVMVTLADVGSSLDWKNLWAQVSEGFHAPLFKLPELFTHSILSAAQS